MKNINTDILETEVGYAYNWLISKAIMISATDITCIGVQKISITELDETNINATRMPFVNYFKFGFIYSHSKYFTGFSVVNTVRVSSLNDFDYTQVYTASNIFFGIILNYKK